MEEVLQLYTSAGYNTQCLKDDFDCSSGLRTLVYPVFVSKLSSEIGILRETEERVSSPEDADNLAEWKIEVTSFLKELNCPHNFLLKGDLEKRFEDKNHRLVLLDFLLGELLEARISEQGKEKNVSQNNSTNGVVVESSTTQQLTMTIKTLNLSAPPSSVTPAQLFKQLLNVLEKINPTLRSVLVGEPLFHGRLGKTAWERLHQGAMDLEREYSVRRTMLMTRLSATLQSFMWTDRAANMSKSLVEAAEMKAFKDKAFSHVSVSDVLAARKDLATINKVSSVPPETRPDQQALTKVKIGRVPDRGGRPSEQAPPPPEMPSWQQRSGPSHGGGGNFYQGGQRGGYRGGRQGGGYKDDRSVSGGGYNQGDGQRGFLSHHDDRNIRDSNQFDQRDRNRGVQGAGWKRSGSRY